MNIAYATSKCPLMHILCPPKFCITFVFQFSWVEKLKTMLMQNFGGQVRCIMGNVEVTYPNLKTYYLSRICSCKIIATRGLLLFFNLQNRQVSLKTLGNILEKLAELAPRDFSEKRLFKQVNELHYVATKMRLKLHKALFTRPALLLKFGHARN